MFYVQGIQGQVFSGPLEQLNRVNGLARAHAVRRINAAEDELVVTGPNLHQREAAVRAYRQMIPSDLERGPLYHADQIMSRPVVVIAADSAVADAWRTLREHRIHQAPVVAPESTLIGLVSERDLLTAIDLEDDQIIAARQRRVREVMTTPVVAAAPVTDIRRIAGVMLEHGVDGVPIVAETGRILGFVSRGDILRAVVTDPPLSLWR